MFFSQLEYKLLRPKTLVLAHRELGSNSSSTLLCLSWASFLTAVPTVSGFHGELRELPQDVLFYYGNSLSSLYSTSVRIQILTSLRWFKVSMSDTLHSFLEWIFAKDQCRKGDHMCMFNLILRFEKLGDM